MVGDLTAQTYIYEYLLVQLLTCAHVHNHDKEAHERLDFPFPQLRNCIGAVFTCN